MASHVFSGHHRCKVVAEFSDGRKRGFDLVVLSFSLTTQPEPVAFLMDGQRVAMPVPALTYELDIICVVDDDLFQRRSFYIRNIYGLSLPSVEVGKFEVGHDGQSVDSLSQQVTLRLIGVFKTFETKGQELLPLEAIDGALRDLAALREIIDRGGE